jgi:hypothetical protein
VQNFLVSGILACGVSIVLSDLRVRAGVVGLVMLLAGCPMGGDSASEDCGDEGQAGEGSRFGGDSIGRRAESYPGTMDGRRVGAMSPQRTLTMATPTPRTRIDASSPVSAMQASQIRGVANTPNAVSDVSASCGDGSAFICSPGGCCGPGVTSTPSACCPTACCTNTVYCDYQTGGCGYTCQAGEQDCGDGTCCPSGTTCSAGACLSPPTCQAGEQDCGNGTCCPGGSTCTINGCEMPGSCEPGQVDCGNDFCCEQGDSCAGGGQCETMECASGQQDCGNGYCCAAGATCVGGGQCEEPGCEPGMVNCGDYCCEAGDSCGSSGQCDRPCEAGEQECGELCCPSGTRCAGSGCEPLEQAGGGGDDEGEAGRSGVGQPGGGDFGDCDEDALRAALGGFSSGNACVDGCIDDALVCAGRSGCVLTSQCQNAETACVMSCF